MLSSDGPGALQASPPPHYHPYVIFFSSCTESSLLHSGFLWLQQVRDTVVTVLGLLIIAASLIVEHRL